MSLTNNASTLSAFLTLIESYGLDPDPIFRKLSLDPKLAQRPYARIPFEKIEALWLEIISATDDPYAGLKSASKWHPSNGGALVYAWMASSSLYTAFLRLVRYLRVVTEGMQCHIDLKDNEFTFIQRFHEESLNIPQHADAVLATMMQLCRRNYGKSLNPLHVTFIHEEPQDCGPYFEFFRCPLTFSAPSNSFTLARAVVDKQLPSSNPMLAQLNDQIIVEYLAKLDNSNILERVKVAIIDQLPNGKVTDSSVACALHFSRRSLHRKLNKEQVTFRKILDDIREELAKQYINDVQLSLNEITFLLGYGEISSFSRAFKRWTGSSPSLYRTFHVSN